ncbi:L2 [Rattus norvegicus papillomavirus 2]|uniref:Minor capsid protein L2 n=1 Tax=Rattus norvegicus papillomavirus 2 TaxID=1036965 RepID=F8SIN5_MNPV|nr:L2 [Rattus norvegicus papillomavirus 2]
MARHKRSTAKSRVPRDSATNIYRTCKQAGTCPPDVINKIEHTTTADKILQYGSAGVFLGGLGIGTGRGTGGATGYVPLGETPGINVGARPVPRPSIPVETVGPQDLFPVDAIRPTDPSVIDVGAPPTSTDTSINVSEVEVIAEVHPIPPEGPINTPTTTLTTPSTSGTGDIAILEVAPEPSPPVRTRLRASKTTHYNPAFHGISTTSSFVGEASGMENISVLCGSGGRIVGGEELELLPLAPSWSSLSSTVVEETEFGGRTSTPTGRRQIPAPSRRYYQYTETPLEELYSPRRAVGQEYINPAFEGDPDISVHFPESMGPAPNRDYTGVTRLEPIFGRMQGSTLRVGRLGQKVSLRTRSGVAIGPRNYFYRDISSIAPIGESMELSTYSVQSLEDPVVFGNDSGEIAEQSVDSFETISLSSWSQISEAELLDDDSYELHGHLVLGTRRGTKQISMPFTRKALPEVAVTVDYGGEESTSRPTPSHEDDRPPIYIGSSPGVDYYLHPSLYKRKRRRRRHSYL